MLLEMGLPYIISKNRFKLYIMQLRSEIVELMMLLARQIAAHEAIVAEATQCAELLKPMSGKRCNEILEKTITDRRGEIASMRRTLAHLTNLLAGMPIENT
ncbi:protein of unknown function [Methylorubrum extorquens]|uniref:Uncharacterized protein n=1 Tax=Methylorubrum extorquens TaxID=408 RepID=A0A2N9AN11_METEX|nr:MULTISPECIES: hypothetical protein [Methylorubrum]WHQ72009.1 hypothetical protein KEC54_10915 [Methylorubrum extorquens]SOR28764.1 protein of unknown function [Methylorubrum extorquens]